MDFLNLASLINGCQLYTHKKTEKSNSLWCADNSRVKLTSYVLVSTDCVWIKKYYNIL